MLSPANRFPKLLNYIILLYAISSLSPQLNECVSTLKFLFLYLDFDCCEIIGNDSSSSISLPNLPLKHNLNVICSFCTTVYHLSLFFKIQKRGSRKGLIEIKKIRCVEKVNLEEQTPVERQYPFQVRGGLQPLDGEPFFFLTFFYSKYIQFIIYLNLSFFYIKSRINNNS